MREAGPLYDLVYGAKDYEGEVALLQAHVGRLRPGAATWLDVACGTGRHLELLQQTYEVEGTDLDAAQLRIARSRLPGVRLTRADMRELRLTRTFDVVSCLFSAVGMMTTLGDLRRAVRKMAEHVAPGGLLIFEPWIRPEDWRDGNISVDTARSSGVAVARICVSSRRGRVSRLDFAFVHATSKRTVTWRERMQLRLSTVDELVDAVERAGLQPSFDEPGLTGRGLLFGLRAATKS